MKVFLISHIADMDGVTPVILTDLTFEEYDYQLLDIPDVDSYVMNCLENHTLDDYDAIFMTDLGVSLEVAKKIDESSWKDKFHLLDHHEGHLELNSFSFAHVVVEENGILESGTSLYYKYLLTHYPNTTLAKDSVSYMVSLVRLNDTWEWKKYQVREAVDLGTLFAYYGNEKFIQNYITFLRKNREFYFLESERILIDVDRKKKEEYIDLCKERMMIQEIHGYQVGIVFAEQYVSEVGNVLAETFQDKIDLVMIIRLDKSLSFRSVKEDVSVRDFAQLFHGDGHVHAAGAPLPEHIHQAIIDELLRENQLL